MAQTQERLTRLMGIPEGYRVLFCQGGASLPFHMLALVNLGIHLGEFWVLEELAADCADDGVYECLLVAQALPITGGTGTPVNPLAIK